MAIARPTPHRVLQKVFWSRPGGALVRGYQAFARRWQYVVMNRSLLSESNGEHWLLGLLPVAPFILDVGFNQGDFSREALRQRPQGRIVGFDPAASMQRTFARDFAGESRIELMPVALSNARAPLGRTHLPTSASRRQRGFFDGVRMRFEFRTNDGPRG